MTTTWWRTWISRPPRPTSAACRTPTWTAARCFRFCKRSDTGWRSDVLIEHLTGYADSVETESDGYTPSFCGVRTPTEMYARYRTGEEEYYRLDVDPYELNNKAHSPKYRDRVSELRSRASELCKPRPPDMGPF